MRKTDVYMRAGALVLALMLALMLVACGSDDDGGDTDAGAQTEETTVESPNTEETDEAPAAGGSQVAVTAKDFEFTGLEDTIPAGETTFNFTNAGKQPHEFILFPLTEDAPSLEKLLKMSEKESDKYLAGKPEATFAEPGKSEEGAFTIELESGARYGYACFVKDPKSKTPHAFLGMNGEFTVE